MRFSGRFVSVVRIAGLTLLLVFVMSCEEDGDKVNGPELGDTHNMLAAVSVGGGPFNVVVTPDGKYVYVANGEDDTISIVSTASHSEVKVVPVDETPGGLAISPDGDFVYVGYFDAHILAVISTASQEVVETADIGDDLEGMMAISPDGTTIYACDFAGGGEIDIISTASRQIIGAIEVDPSMHIAVSADGEDLYVVNPTNNQLVQISTATRQVMNTIPLGQGTHDFTDLVISPDGDFVYIPVGNLVAVVSTTSKEVVKIITIGGEFVGDLDLTGVAVAPDGKFVYVANAEENSVAIISTEINSVVDTITVGRGPGEIAVNPDGTAIYVANFQDNSVSVIARE